MASPSHDALDILIRSDAWGTRRILSLCRKLSHEQFHREFPIGLGSLHETLVHTIGAMRSWTDRIAGREKRPWLFTVRSGERRGVPGRDYDMQELAALLDEAEQDLLAVVAMPHERFAVPLVVESRGADGSLTRSTFSRAAVVVHICTHGYYHRAQAMNMLRHMGVPGLIDPSLELGALDWQEQIDCPPVVLTSPLTPEGHP